MQAKVETMQEQDKQFDFLKEKMELMQKQMDLTQEKAELMQQNMKLQDMYDQQVAENSKLLRENHELRFLSQIKDTKVRTRGPEFTKKLNNGRGETRGIQHGERRNRFQGK